MAHCWLAQGCDGHVAGGFLGDFYKGPIPDQLPVDLQDGIRLHRHVDTLTNQLPEFRSTYASFQPELRRAAPILVDLIADHLLAKFWSKHGAGSLQEFTCNCYRIIGQYKIPTSGQRLFHHVVARNLWYEYADFNVIFSVMCRILTRLRMEEQLVHLAKLEPDLDDHYLNFCKYFPVLETAVGEWKLSHAQSRE